MKKLGGLRAGTPVSALVLFARVLFGQGSPVQISLTPSSSAANLNGTLSLNLTVTTVPGSEPSGIEWTLSYPAGDVAAIDVAAGPALTMAGKSIFCNHRVGMITCLGVGLNANPIYNGVAAVVTLTLAPTTASSLLPLPVGATSAVLGDGTALSAGGNGSTVTVVGWQPPVQTYFTDIAPTDPNYSAANLLYAKGISKGCGANPLTFCPDHNITRAEMATLLIRATLGGDPTSFNPLPYFADVPASHLYFEWIQKLYELGITHGCANNPLMFCPDGTVTRGEIAAFTTNARYAGVTSFTYSAIPYFTDVPPTDIFFQSIQKMAELGVPSCSPLLFCSTQAATRGDVAGFLVRGLLNDLLPIGTPVLSMVGTSAVSRGTTFLSVLIIGTNTHFANGSTLTAGPGVTVSGLAVLNAQTLVANLSVSSSATPGPRSLIVTSGSEEAVLPNGLMVQ